jgi:uncharacterized protein (DUF433 family)
MKEITKKLLVFQNNVTAIKKDGKNPHFKNSYATLTQILSEVKPLLTELGLVLIQPINHTLVSTTIIDSESGESISSSIEMPSGLNAQQVGSCITYYRRYSIASLLSLELEDDDGNTATAPQTDKEWLNKYSDKNKTVISENWNKVVESLKKGYTIEQVESKYRLSKELKAELLNIK